MVAAPVHADDLLNIRRSQPAAFVDADIADRYTASRPPQALSQALRTEKWLRKLASPAHIRRSLRELTEPLPGYASDATTYSVNLANAFKLRVDRIFAPAKLLVVEDLFRPYLLGAAQRCSVAEGGTYGLAIPSNGRSSVLTIGGGGDFYLGRRLVLHFDAASVMHSGPLQGEDHHRVGAGLKLAF